MSSSPRPLQLTQVFNMATGQIDNAERYLEQGDRRRTRVRRLLTDYYLQGKKYLVCPLCFGQLFIREGGKRPHFVHYNTEEFSSCPNHEKTTHQSPNDIKAKQYNGVQESLRHQRLKNIIAEIIASDKECSNTIIDKCYIYRENHERYRPDIQTLYRDKNIVFEIQISKEFITFISSREAYYKEKNAFLIWIFDENSKILDQQYEKDIFFTNNSQLFFINNELIEKSKKLAKLHLNVIYNTPFIESSVKIRTRRNIKEITLDDITFDHSNGKAYFYPYDNHFNNLRKRLIYFNIIKFLADKDDSSLNTYLHRISDINEPFDFQLSTFLIFMLSAKKGTDILQRGDSQFHNNYSQLLNRYGGGKKDNGFFIFTLY